MTKDRSSSYIVTDNQQNSAEILFILDYIIGLDSILSTPSKVRSVVLFFNCRVMCVAAGAKCTYMVATCDPWT